MIMTAMMVGSCGGDQSGSGSSTNMTKGPIRPPSVADQFYPGDRTALAKVVDRFIQAANPPAFDGVPVAFLVPHAGYVFSGGVAAYSYKALKGREITDVILIGNSHHFGFTKGAVYARGAYRTPLGDVPVNEDLARCVIASTPLLEENPMPHGQEHSLEVQLPFLQRTLGDFRIVPILMSQFSMTQCKAIGEGIAKAIQNSGQADKIMIVNSSDMSHYPRKADADRVDRGALKVLEQFDPEALAEYMLEQLNDRIPHLACVFCGEESLYATMFAAKALKADTATVLHYANSGDVSGDEDRVVGYGAAVFSRAGNDKAKEKKSEEKTKAVDSSPAQEFSISSENQAWLLGLARQSIDVYLTSNRLANIRSHDEALMVPAAVFVTLTQRGQLRGCIGTTEPRAPLYQAVLELAVAAAVEDPRFPPVNRKELNQIHIEISVLSPLQKVENADAIIPGKHGVVVRRGGRSGLFLPQVWEHFPGPDRKAEFLGELCRQKAGLADDAWKDPKTELLVFTVAAFEEKK